MTSSAQKLFPIIKFETEDMLDLSYKTGHFSAAIAFYSIVHFTYEQVQLAFEEINRVLKPCGQFLFSFHIGDEIVHHNTFLDKQVDIDFYFFETEKILLMLGKAQFEIIDVLERHPYKEVEYPSKRAYLWIKKLN